MLNFDTRLDIPTEQTKTTQIRHDEKLADLIECASRALAVEESAFIRYAIKLEAMRVLKLQSWHEMTREDVEAFTAASDSPPAPTPRALKAARSYKERVVYAE